MMRGMIALIRGSLANMALLLCEVGLRLFHPKYAYLAEAPFARDPNLIMIRIPSHRSFAGHPDTGSPHPFFHNNLGLRQHRDFSAADLESSVNIGFFGDSFTENVLMKAQHSFTEPLDYLLNIGGGGSTCSISASMTMERRIPYCATRCWIFGRPSIMCSTSFTKTISKTILQAICSVSTMRGSW